MVMIDDSVYVEQHSRHRSALERSPGATEVHVAIGSPALAYPCFHWLISKPVRVGASNHTVEETRQIIADSLTSLLKV